MIATSYLSFGKVPEMEGRGNHICAPGDVRFDPHAGTDR